MSTVLVVEDTPSELVLISDFLRQSGYNVINAIDAQEALHKVFEYKPDIIVTDVVMPGKNGFQLCRILKKNPETQKIPVIICSSKNQEIDRLWGMKQGADAYVTKPFTKTDLIRVIKSIAL